MCCVLGSKVSKSGVEHIGGSTLCIFIDIFYLFSPVLFTSEYNSMVQRTKNIYFPDNGEDIMI